MVEDPAPLVAHDRQVHKARRKVENLFCRTKDFTRVTLRKCETSRSYAGFVSLACALVNIRRCR